MPKCIWDQLAKPLDVAHDAGVDGFFDSCLMAREIPFARVNYPNITRYVVPAVDAYFAETILERCIRERAAEPARPKAKKLGSNSLIGRRRPGSLHG